ncbi:MAG: MCP four helix bundle domain-containing protein [Labilithrix sp.]|nr:MCP four helix bundle domain-containing protein [Labilithrix sp.]MBX3220910.1 MCP four helix bundle domain-containing protein [Labilithrix sp.]
MSWSSTHDRARRSVRVVWLLIASFFLTVASFIAATSVAEHRARGIEAAAESITTNALPSIACLSRVRTELRQIQMLLERLTSAGPRHVQSDMAELRESRDDLARDTQRCLELPTYPGEKALQDRIGLRSSTMNTSMDRVLVRLDTGDKAGAATELLARTEPALDQLDETFVENIDLNARQSSTLGAEIRSIRTSSQSILAFLIALSVLLASAVALMMVRVLRRFTSLMEGRVTEMEHFAGRVAHDIRSPLAAVGLALELTKRDPEALSRGVLDRASKTLQRVGQLVDGLLIFARSGAPPQESAATNAAEVMSGVVDEMSSSAAESGITLSLEKPDPSVFVASSPGVLISILSNLVGNAIKNMGCAPERKVDIRARELAESVRFEVRDTGPGLPKEMRERIFDPYLRAAESALPGLGLGLATVRRLVEAHGGKVGAAPNDGAGSLFWFELPKAATPRVGPLEQATRRLTLRHHRPRPT